MQQACVHATNHSRVRTNQDSRRTGLAGHALRRPVYGHYSQHARNLGTSKQVYGTAAESWGGDGLGGKLRVGNEYDAGDDGGGGGGGGSSCEVNGDELHAVMRGGPSSRNLSADSTRTANLVPGGLQQLFV